MIPQTNDLHSPRSPDPRSKFADPKRNPSLLLNSTSVVSRSNRPPIWKCRCSMFSLISFCALLGPKMTIASSQTFEFFSCYTLDTQAPLCSTTEKLGIKFLSATQPPSSPRYFENGEPVRIGRKWTPASRCCARPPPASLHSSTLLPGPRLSWRYPFPFGFFPLPSWTSVAACTTRCPLPLK